jgi:hypothetical protein
MGKLVRGPLTANLHHNPTALRKLLLFILLIALAPAIYAQERRRFAGYVQLDGGAQTPYYLDLIITGKVISGYSITGNEGGNKPHALVTGTITGTEMSIEEKPWGSNTAQVYCYFSAHLKPYAAGNRQSWSGPFTGRNVNGSACDAGTMTVTDNTLAQDIPVPPPVIKDTVKKEAPKAIVATRSAASVPSLDAPTASDSCQRIYNWHSDSLSIDIWDGWTIDGDVVSLSVGKQSLLSHARLNEHKQHFMVAVNPGLNTITVALHEEGFDPPNTPNLIVYDGIEKHELNISGANGQVVRVCLWRER